MTEMVTSGSMSGEGKRSDGLLGESDYERRRSLQAPPALHATALFLDSTEPNFTRRGDPNVQNALQTGGITGEAWEWHQGKGWSKVPGSESAGPNGIDVSKDGKTLYIGAWGTQTLIRLSRGQTPVKKDTVQVSFHIDNVHWAPDGTLF